jgi:O-antigen/teichoic acid export membrane protein
LTGLIKKYLKSDFFRNVATLSVGTAFAQAIPLLISPLLTRLYTPDDFGELTLFTSFTALFVVVASLRYEIAILLPDKDEDALLLTRLSGKIATWVAMGLVIALPCWYLASKYFSPGSFHTIYWLVPASVLLMAANQIQVSWLSRKRNYRNMAKSRFSQAAASGAFTLLFGVLGFGFWGLGAGTVIGQLTTVLVSYRASGKAIYHKILSTPFKTFKPIAQRYQNFPRYNAPHALIDSITNNGINFFIDFLLGSIVTGFYGFTFRLLKAPSLLISGAVYQVFYQRAVEMHNKRESIRPQLLRVYIQLFLLAVVPFGTLFFVGPDLFAYIFGEKWRAAGELSAIIAPWLLLNFVMLPGTCLAAVKEKQASALLYITIDISMRFLAFYLGFNYLDTPHGAFIAFSVVATSMQVFWMGWYYKLAGKE